MRAPKENSPEARTYMGTEMERDAGDWLRRPMRRVQQGVEFDLGRGMTGGFRVAGHSNLHVWNGWEWILPDYSPKLAHDGSVIFQPASGVRWAGDTFHGPDGRSVTLRSAGVLDKGLYHPVWQAGPLHADPFLLRQSVGPFEHEIHVLQGSMRSEIHIQEMPRLPGGDALAFEFCADRMLPPEQCPCHPWYQDAAGFRADVTKLRWLGGRYEYIPLTNLERLTFPIVIDPETCTLTLKCGGTGFKITPYLDARNLLAGSTFFCYNAPANQNVGQFYTADEPSGFYVQRFYDGWDSAGGSGVILAAEVKVGCALAIVPGVLDEDYLFKHFDGANRSCANAAECKQMFLDTDTTGTTIVATKFELNAAGVGNYGPYHALVAADVAHLNATYGFGNIFGYPLYFGVQSQDDYDSVAPASFERKYSYTLAPCLKYNAAAGGYIWLVGG